MYMHLNYNSSSSALNVPSEYLSVNRPMPPASPPPWTQLDPEMKAFIERTVSAWKFDATVDTDACQGDAAPATANPPGIRQP